MAPESLGDGVRGRREQALTESQTDAIVKAGVLGVFWVRLYRGDTLGGGAGTEDIDSSAVVQ